MQNRRTTIRLNRIHCYDEDEGDGIGSAEPSLWTVRFRTGGDTARVTPALSLQGTATVIGTPGDHGDPPDHGGDPGEHVTARARTRVFSTVLRPVPLQQPVGNVTGVGGRVVLLVEDHAPDPAIARGHAALDRAVLRA